MANKPTSELMLRTQIHTLRELLRAAQNRRSVLTPSYNGFRKPCPAAFVMQLSGELIFKMLSAGMYLYEKPPKPERFLTYRKKGDTT